MRGFAILAAAAAAISSIAYADTAGRPECSSILPPARLPEGMRALQPEDLARLRDIGAQEPQFYGSPSFTVSPDRKSAAFQLRRGDPERNTYCLAMVVLDLTGKAPPRIIDEGSEPILITIDMRGVADFPTGNIRIVTPRWSADGKWIAFLKKVAGSTQVWRAFSDGSGSAPLTHSDDDVVDFRIAPDGSSIVYATRPGLNRDRRQNEKDGLNGWHYDDRFNPSVSKHPFPLAGAERHAQVLDPATGAVRPATAQESAMVAVDDEFPAQAGAGVPTNVPGLEITATNLSGTAKAGGLRARLADGSVAACSAPACEGAINPWWTPGRAHVRFRRSEGWANASTAIYDWDPKSGAVRRLYVTDDVLTSCTTDLKSLICLRHASLVPGELVRLDPATGKRVTLFELNPEFRHLTLGRAERLHWRNAFGAETAGDLVFPVGYRPGRKYPLVIVQYDTRGFLRGGTDDEYPIQAFANRGYAVLSFKRPQMPSGKTAKDFEQLGRQNLEHFADRRNVESSLEGGVRLIIDRGIADPRQIGITGLSDGSSTVEWALIHSSLFSAAATSSCCTDSTFVATVGPGAARHFLGEGYPGVLERDDPFWKEVSLGDNARRISTPILINASEEEFLDTLITFSALREAGVPVDLFEYPGEFHARWQPAHRLATYRRSLDWFDYWLRGIRSKDADRQPELIEWDRLKREAGHGVPI